MVRARRAERYSVGQTSEGAVITMRQNREALSAAAVLAAMLLACWCVGPSGPKPIPYFHGWLYLSAFGLLALSVGLGLFWSMYRERWVITDREIIVTDTFGWANRRIPWGELLRIRLDTNAVGVVGAAYPYEVELEDQARQPLLPGFGFSTSTAAGDFIEALRTLLPSANIDSPRTHGPLRSAPNLH